MMECFHKLVGPPLRHMDEPPKDITANPVKEKINSMPSKSQEFIGGSHSTVPATSTPNIASKNRLPQPTHPASETHQHVAIPPVQQPKETPMRPIPKSSAIETPINIAQQILSTNSVLAYHASSSQQPVQQTPVQAKKGALSVCHTLPIVNIDRVIGQWKGLYEIRARWSWWQFKSI